MKDPALPVYRAVQRTHGFWTLHLCLRIAVGFPAAHMRSPALTDCIDAIRSAGCCNEKHGVVVQGNNR
eukprot:5787547-Amphidinium_carterae.1